MHLNTILRYPKTLNGLNFVSDLCILGSTQIISPSQRCNQLPSGPGCGSISSCQGELPTLPTSMGAVQGA